MIQAIVDSIIAAILEVFPGANIYDEKVKQGFKTPCFIIRCINPLSEQVLGNRYYRQNLFSIQYSPDEKNANSECYRVQDVLFRALEYIKVDDDLQRGTNMRGEVIDGVLTFLINFNMFIYFKDELDPMENLEHKTNVKQGV